MKVAAEEFAVVEAAVEEHAAVGVAAVELAREGCCREVAGTVLAAVVEHTAPKGPT